MGAGGVHFAGEQYLQQARELCRERGVLWVSDEVITGYGRTGEWFASTRFGLEPDLVLSAKGLTSGYAPMGAVLVAPSVTEPFWNGDRGCLAARVHLLRSRRRGSGRSGQPRHHRARRTGGAGARPRAGCSPRRSPAWSTTRWSPRCVRVSGCSPPSRSSRTWSSRRCCPWSRGGRSAAIARRADPAAGRRVAPGVATVRRDRLKS